MRIALLFPTFYPTIGGIETYIKQLAEHFAASGNEVAVFTSDPHYKNRENVPGRVSIIYLASKYFLGYMIPAKKSLLSVKEWRPDMIHVNLPHPYCTVFSWHMRKTGIPLLATYHGNANPKSLLKLLVARLETQFYRFFYKKIIVTTDFYKQKAATFFSPAKIAAINLGVDKIFFDRTLTPEHACSKLGIPENQKTVLFVGAMDKAHLYKGIPVLLKCAAQTPEIEYIFIGSGSEKNSYRKLAENFELKNCTFLDAVDTQLLALYYKAANILILPSTSSSEGFGLVLLEAMASGTPVITTNQAGSGKLIAEHQAGLITKAGSHKSLKQNIEKILNDPLLTKKIITNGLKLAANMNWPAAAQKTLQIYEQILRKN